MIIYQQPWKKPILPPLANYVRGTDIPVIRLTQPSHVWKRFLSPSVNFQTDTSDDGWECVQVPFDDTLLLRKYKSCAYRCTFPVLANFAGHKIFLRMEGAGGFCKLWVNGQLAGEHYGAFTSWCCEITPFAQAGTQAVLTLQAEDKTSEISPYQSGGILREIYLAAFPETHIESLHVRTTFDAVFKDATLEICISLSQPLKGRRIAFTLLDSAGETVSLSTPIPELADGCRQWNGSVLVPSPAKWDSEHPNLYTLQAEIIDENGILQRVCKKIGFRQIEIRGQSVFVNGDRIKLRGICRMDASPKKGKALDYALLEQDMKLLKEANVNFLRTANYPADEYLLELCDRFGMYVQADTAVSDVDWGLPPTQNDPAFYEKYMGQLSDMLERDQSHPCILLWNLGNHSSWGENFRAGFRYIKQQDPTRPVLFNYPLSMQESDAPPDIWSVHYAAHNLNLSEPYDHMIIGHIHGSDKAPGYALGKALDMKLPILHDEFALVPCYIRDQMKHDPGVRDFWGESIARFSDALWEADGALGGAVGFFCDAEGSELDSSVQWGIVDIWRRKKPEYHHLKMAYQPVKFFPSEVSNGILSVPVENRYNHTNLRELDIFWTSGKKSPVQVKVNIAPGQRGEIRFPCSERTGEVRLSFREPSGHTVEWAIALGEEAPAVPPIVPDEIRIIRAKDTTEIVSGTSRFVFSHATGLLVSGDIEENTILTGGPYLNLTGIRLPQWRKKSLQISEKSGVASVQISGSYGDVAEVDFTILIGADGRFDTSYTLQKLTRPMPRTVKANVGLDQGGLTELGVYYQLSAKADTLSWSRKGLWPLYPTNHIGRNTGTAAARGTHLLPKPGELPAAGWNEDTVNYGLYGKYDLPLRGSNDFRSMKHNILTAACGIEGVGSVQAFSDGSHSVRAEILPAPKNMIDDQNSSIRYAGTWYTIEDVSGCHKNTETLSNTPKSAAEYTFTGTGIVWYGSTDTLYGMAEVWLDGTCMDDAVHLYPDSVEFPGMSRGYEKRYGKMLYSIRGLPLGKHTLRVLVSGKKESAAQDCYVSIDAFRVLDETTPEHGSIKFAVNNDYNYPRLVWGNYTKPRVHIKAGCTGCVHLKLVRDIKIGSEEESVW